MNRFWEDKRLEELTRQEWEALCDGCGRCCLHKLQDDESDEVYYTRVACHLLDLESGRCRHYAQRQRLVPDCMVLNAEAMAALEWLPHSCAYRLRAAGKPLPAWHPLVSGRADSVREAGMSVTRFAIPEQALAHPDELEDHLILWPL